ncbi:HNH endonuclease signature motif containing protein, partial [Actinomycetospora straminea]|uniref:HNH endonuclease signature motif containing protein n=1 Tax=Actinomycetospora straminea TaxID=663607 RepID=UPI0031E5A493
LVTITMDHRWLQAATGHATLDSGQRVAAATVRRWACDAEVVPVVLGSRSEPLDVGRATRTVPDALRRALNVRDGGCAHPGCDRRPRRCHAHHLHHWSNGGDTCLANLVLLCRYHHRLIHHGQWQVAIVDGRPWFTPPPWIDPDQRPRPGGRPHVPL